MAHGLILDPTATRQDDIASHGPDVGALSGKRIGFRVDRMWRAWDWISELWADKLRTAGAEVSFWRSAGRSGEEGERCEREYEAFLEQIDAAVVGLANCGSCTGWTIRDAISAANRGLPTTAVATANFETFAHEIARRGGRSGLRVHVLPYPLNECERTEVLSIGEAHFHGLLETMGAQLAVQEVTA
ncbi:UGSC family (seleno)protein [Mycobacterium arosiense]|uniref:UGSC-like domain-containing protein n=1 Tax=Mycobacterium arosiense ATCC BAA-1401 = DSM 45069 TaxID=1265311 RepID=A0A1W9ZNP9_MYCAI|nr:hypothetical protein [Mycobacterium arosiense]ORA19482.1 hypothetical protein BST14_05420 [Mycobacterium arosiense ATCC BAA-1401 = DSM 45069]